MSSLNHFYFYTTSTACFLILVRVVAFSDTISLLKSWTSNRSHGKHSRSPCQASTCFSDCGGQGVESSAVLFQALQPRPESFKPGTEELCTGFVLRQEAHPETDLVAVHSYNQVGATTRFLSDPTARRVPANVFRDSSRAHKSALHFGLECRTSQSRTRVVPI